MEHMVIKGCLALTLHVLWPRKNLSVNWRQGGWAESHWPAIAHLPQLPSLPPRQWSNSASHFSSLYLSTKCFKSSPKFLSHLENKEQSKAKVFCHTKEDCQRWAEKTESTGWKWWHEKEEELGNGKPKRAFPMRHGSWYRVGTWHLLNDWIFDWELTILIFILTRGFTLPETHEFKSKQSFWGKNILRLNSGP